MGKGLNPALMKSMQFFQQAQKTEEAGNLQKAVMFYQAAIQTWPANGNAHAGLLSLLVQRRDFDNVGKVLAGVPEDVLRQSERIRYIKGIYLLETYQIEEALALFEPLRGCDKINSLGLLNNIGTCYNKLERYPEALEEYRSAQAAGLDVPELWVNIAGSLKKAGNYREAEAVFREALARYPDDPSIRYEYAVTLLTDSQFERGFEFYEARWQAPQFSAPRPAVPLPDWQPGSLEKVLVVAEQGVGDQVLYSALIQSFAHQATEVGLVVEPRLKALLQRSNPEIRVLEPADLEANPGIFSEYDSWIAEASLPRYMWRDIGKRMPFLTPDPARVAHFRDKYQRLFPGKTVVGLSWKSKREEYGVKKSVAISEWQEVLRREDLVFVCMQYGDVAEDIETARDLFGTEIHIDDEVDLFDDIDDITALSQALDVVVSTSNTTAHLAAAAGATVKLVVPAGTALLWYWGHSGDRCDWYPGVEIFRPGKIGDWAPTIKRVADAIE